MCFGMKNGAPKPSLSSCRLWSSEMSMYLSPCVSLRQKSASWKVCITLHLAPSLAPPPLSLVSEGAARPTTGARELMGKVFFSWLTQHSRSPGISHRQSKVAVSHGSWTQFCKWSKDFTTWDLAWVVGPSTHLLFEGLFDPFCICLKF